jgi:hypothetical protein
MKHTARILGLLLGLIVSVAGIAPHRAAAQATTQRAASIVIFPKVVVDASRDTVIQITNTSPFLGAPVLCLYLDGELASPGLPPSPANPPRCAETNFDLPLMPRQPTHWVASQGRAVDASDTVAGLDPGLIPPVANGFEGALFCIEVDALGAPISGNHLIGTATLQDRTNGDVAQYNAIGLRGLDTNDGDGTLCLGGGVTTACPNGAEYDACPTDWNLDHFADAAEDSVVGTGSSVTTNLTVVPCSQDFLLANPTPVTLQMMIYNEFEQPFSASKQVPCWMDSRLGLLGAAFNFGFLGTTYAQTKLHPVLQGGVAMVAQEFHDAPGGLS